MLRFIRSMTLIQWLVLVSILATFAAVLIPPVKWASSGKREVTVRVHVFDATEMQPLAGVDVTLMFGPAGSPANPPQIVSGKEGSAGPGLFPTATTDVGGSARLTGSFSSSASYLNPKGRIGLQRGWLVIRAAGYGGAAIPVRHESMPRPDVIEMGEVPVFVGLLKAE